MAKLNRREFISTGSAAVTAGALAAGGGKTYLLAANPEPSPVYSANDHIQVALIGAGPEGQENVAPRAADVPGVKLVAVADCSDSRLARCKERFGADIQTTRDYHEILSRKDVDAVIIATPDFWHKQAAVDAMNAGKDVYLEKPMIHAYSDGPEIIETARKTQRILQVGSQRVSSITHKKAQELYKAGAIGQLVAVESWWDRFPFDPVGAFNATIPPDLSPETVDWERWLGSLPNEPFNAEHFLQWRKWKVYGSGVAGDLFVHLVSGLHFLIESIGPTQVYATGGIRYWKDGRDQPDVLMGLYDYPEGFNLSLRANFVEGAQATSGLVLVGSEGMMKIDYNFEIRKETVSVTRATKPLYPPYEIDTFSAASQRQFMAEYRQKYPAPNPPMTMFEAQETYAAPSEYSDLYDHVKNFLDSVRSRKPVVEDPVFGFRAAGAALLANVSYEEKRAVKWDPQHMRIV